MKILHTADIHLGSKIDARLPKELAEIRRTELRKSFQNMIEYANMHTIKVILLAGDIFDSDLPLKHDKVFFYQLIASNSHIDFYYLRGNHDCKASYIQTLPNLKTFTDSWSYYNITTAYGNTITIAGIEQTAQNAKSLYNDIQLANQSINIVLLHGQESSSQFGKDIVNIAALQHKNIDYLALGHIHSYAYKKLDERGNYAYCGCLEGRGFDEIGKKGFIELTIENNTVKHKFIATSQRQILEKSVDLSSCNSFLEAIDKIKAECFIEKMHIYKLILTGALQFEKTGLVEIIKNQFSTNCFFIEIVDKTTIKYDIEAIQKENSLRGEFVKIVVNSTQSNGFKEKVIDIGLKALSGNDLT